MFKKCVALILLFSTNVFAMKVLAQQPNTHSKAETDITEVSDAELAGERDAQTNTQTLRYFAYGACAGCSLTAVFSFVTYFVADSMYPEDKRYDIKIRKVHGGLPYSFFGDGTQTTRTPIPEKIDAYNRVLTIGKIASPMLALFFSNLWFSTERKPVPSAIHFVGRSSDYVQAYTKAYKAKARAVERSAFFSGSAVGAMCIFVGCILN